MDLFVTKEIVNPSLKHKAVLIKGYDVDGDVWNDVFLVKEVYTESLLLIGPSGNEIELHHENFKDDLLKITVWEVN